MKTRRATTTLGVLVLACGVVLGWSVMGAGDFYVIPVVKKGAPANPAPVPKTGQTECYKSAEPGGTCTCGTADCPPGQDGDLEKGAAWPNPRFTDNGNGTVTDNLTGLVWTKNADCQGTMNWGDALAHCNALMSGACGLTDGSVAGDWRLPNRRELESLVDLRYYDPAMPNTAGTGQASEGDPFTNLRSSWYWSSSTYASSTNYAWYVDFIYGYVYTYDKTYANYVRCVR